MVAIKWVGSPNFKAQNGVAKTFITMHWMVGTLRSTDSAFNSGRAASATYGVGESEIHQYVNEKDYPFSDGNTYANQHTISIEHEGGYLLADGTRKNPSPAVQELSAQLVADIARRHNFGKLVLGTNIFPHSHWVATACPGSLNLNGIIARANELLGNPNAPITGANAGSSASSYGEATSVATYQALLNKQGYNLAVDGQKGPLTTAAIRDFQSKHGLEVDGLVGPLTLGALGGTVANSGKLTVDGQWGALTTKALQRALGVTADGQIGPQTIKALQKRVGVTQDGILGPVTRKALQRRLGVTQDGKWGPNTARALQNRLNAGSF